ncbi:MAG: DUF5110 domain-containing protein, partial [Firmicutes bacterium]|nr:DUF5110 domain-containing protein [Bacillota bacterium]
WIYTVTGETVYGPQTITVQCDIRQMPIFVRKGAVIPLADETLTVQGSDWSHLTLDFYPSTRQFAETYLYEDDTMSNAYELGQFRTTALSTSFEGGKAILRIGAAQGAFDGPRAFNEREWTVRVHRPGGWGELTGVTVNGKSAPFTKIPRDPHAMPLDNEGGATDGDVYIVRLRARVNEAQELVFTFDHPVDPPVPAGNYEGPRVQMVIHTGRAGDTTTTGAQVVQGELTVALSHWYAPQDVMEAVLMVYPVRGGEVQGQLGELLYSGSEVPAALPIDTRQLADGTYELEFRVGSRDGRVSSSRQRIIVRNWSVLLDPFSPPEPMGWFGVLDRSLTVYETPGWDYATDDPAAFFDDAARRVWLGDGTGHLVWEYPGLRRIIVTAYTRNTELPSFAIGVSENQDEWIGLAWQMEDIATSPSGWHQIRVYADISEPAEVRYVRVSVGDGLDGTILQLGAVELVREAPASGR